MAIDINQNDPTFDPTNTGSGTTDPAIDQAAYLDAIRQLYRDLLGREAGPGEAESWASTNNLGAISDGIKASQEYKARTGASGTTGTGSGTGSTTTTGKFDPVALRAALMGHTAPATSAELQKFIQAHPEFATGVTVGGSKLNKLYGPNGQFLADVIRGTSGPSPTWDWDSSVGGSTSSGGVDESYLQPFNQSFSDFYTSLYGKGPTGSPTFAAPGEFSGVDPNQIAADPGYQFRKQEAAGALQNAAAAKGVLNDSGTLYSLLRQGDAMAGQEFQNAWNRNFDKWNSDWSHALGAFGANQSTTDSDYSKAWQQYVENKDTFYRNQNEAFDKLYRSSNLGLGAVQ